MTGRGGDVEGEPPRRWERLLAWSVPPGQRRAALGDAREEFGRRRARDGLRPARRWYRRQALGSLPAGASHRFRAFLDGWRTNETTGEGMAMWLGDVRLALRVLGKRPGFTLTVAVTLALGIGAVTALYGVFRTVFLQPLPLPESQELVVVMETATFGCCGPASGPDYLDWVQRQRSFDGMAALNPGYFNLTGLDEPERTYGTWVTASAFQLLGVAPLLGRAIVPEDQVSPQVVLLSYELWQRVFGGRSDVLGSSLELDGQTYTIIGVMPQGFDVPSPWARTIRHQLYLPFADQALAGNRGSHGFPVIARRSEGVTVEAAQADMDRIMRELASEYPATNSDRGTQVFGLHEYLFGPVGRQLKLILAAAGLVLLIACGNVASLQLARAAARDTELAVRGALGASRRAVMRLLFSESLLLAGVGGILGTLAAYAMVAGLKAVLPATIPRVDEVTVDGWALLFALGATAFTALAFGMIPAIWASRSDLASGVREGGYHALAPHKERVRDYFIIGQIALGLVLANGAALLVRSYTQLRGQEYGFDTDDVLTLALSPAGPRYQSGEDLEAFYQQVDEAVAAIPGVTSVGMVTRLPLAGGSNGNVLVEGRGPRTSSDQGPLVEVVSVIGDYFQAMGIPLLTGRALTADDSVSSATGVLINQAMADQVWAGENPLGKRFSFSDNPPNWLTVVGVVGTTRQWSPEQPPIAQAYFPFTRGWSSSGYVVVKTAGDPAALVGQVRRAALSVDPTQPPSDIRVMGDRLASALAQRRFYTTLIALFAMAALFLASAGIYGTVSYYVTRRFRELGIRMALGAGGTGIVGLVLRRGARLAVWGVGLGLVGVWAATSVVGSLVYGVGAMDALTLVGGCLVLAGVALAASTLPAVRAARVPPVLALRSE